MPRRSSSSTSSTRSAVRAGGAHNREHDQTLNQLLVELDGFGGADEVVIMGASNRLQDLDPALLRPGRFDRQVNVAPPDLQGREEIFRVHTRSKPLGADVDITVLAPTYRRPDRSRSREHRERGRDLRSPQRPAIHPAGGLRGGHGARADRASEAPVVTEKEKRILAYHEGGHALLAYLMGDVMPVQKVTIVGRGDALGSPTTSPSRTRYLHTKESCSTS